VAGACFGVGLVQVIATWHTRHTRLSILGRELARRPADQPADEILLVLAGAPIKRAGAPESPIAKSMRGATSVQLSAARAPRHSDSAPPP
jgi:hypothetical protein